MFPDPARDYQCPDQLRCELKFGGGSPITKQPLVRLVNVWKRFGSIQALAGASLDVYPGEIHVVLGENGAGKTSLMCVLAGLYRPDQGEVLVNGQQFAVRTPADALKLGVTMVHQHFELVDNLSVWENVVLGAEGGRFALTRRRCHQAVRQLASEHGVEVDIDARVRDLPVGLQQKVEILKMLYRRARILILDEPTTFLTPQEVDTLLVTLQRLAASGLAILLVTHKLRDALRVGDRLTVMRGGRVVASLPAAGGTEELLVQWMMGEPPAAATKLLETARPAPPAPDAPVLLEVEETSTVGTHNRLRLQGISFRLRAGEIVGVAGVAGSGQRELAELLVGLLPVAAGRIRLSGVDITKLPIRDRLDRGLVLVPEDRVRDGILPGMTLAETVVLGLHRHLFPNVWYDFARAMQLGRNAIEQHAVRAPHPLIPSTYLSGGNIQKLILARAVETCRIRAEPVVVALNPSRGLDVRAVQHVHQQLRSVVGRGGAVLLVSEDLDELIGLCHHIVVLHRGQTVAEFDGPGYDRYSIGEAMLGSAA